MTTQNREIKATANYAARTFTIRTYIKGELIAKYRTTRMNADEFQSSLHNTQDDWAQYLKSSDCYAVS